MRIRPKCFLIEIVILVLLSANGVSQDLPIDGVISFGNPEIIADLDVAPTGIFGGNAIIASRNFVDTPDSIPSRIGFYFNDGSSPWDRAPVPVGFYGSGDILADASIQSILSVNVPNRHSSIFAGVLAFENEDGTNFHHFVAQMSQRGFEGWMVVLEETVPNGPISIDVNPSGVIGVGGVMVSSDDSSFAPEQFSYASQIQLDGTHDWTLILERCTPESPVFCASDVQGNVYVAASNPGRKSKPDQVVYCIDGIGDQVWRQSLKLPGRGLNITGIAADDSGGSYVVGNSASGGRNSMNTEAHVIALGTNGEKRWEHSTKGGRTMYNDIGYIPYDVLDDIGDSLIIGGSIEGRVKFSKGRASITRTSTIESDALLLEVSKNGQIEWVKALPSSGRSEISKVRPDGNQGYVATGTFEGITDLNINGESEFVESPPGGEILVIIYRWAIRFIGTA